MPRTIKGAKIACLDFNLNRQKMKQGVRVVIEDAKALAGIQEKEKDLMKEQIELILKAGANVVLTTKGSACSPLLSFD